MITCSIVGATSYTAAELIRLLARHPHVKVGSLTSRSEEKILIHDLVPALPKDSDLQIEKLDLKKISQISDVVFLTLPHMCAMEVAGALLKAEKVVIDLSADFRLKDAGLYERWYARKHDHPELLAQAVYGLPEYYREQIRNACLIANPGCYPTGAILGISPLLKAGLIEPDSVIVDAKSGVSGAGRKLVPTTQYCEANENFSAYKVNAHQHMPEIEQILSDIAREKIGMTFVPHLLPVNRGILSTIYLKLKKGVGANRVAETFEAFSAREPFVRFLGAGKFPCLKNVQHTNFCDIGVKTDEGSNQVIVITAIDNLMKGASSQAIQNMNIRFGFDERTAIQ